MGVLPNIMLKALNTAPGVTKLVDPCSDDMYQPASIDIHLNIKEMYVWTGTMMHSYDPETKDLRHWEKLTPIPMEDGRQVVVLKPPCFYLMSSQEYVSVPTTLLGLMHGVSSLARLSFSPHQQAGLLDPGWHGNITGEVKVGCWLELTVAWPNNPKFKPPRLGQITFHTLEMEATPGYEGRYQADTGTVPYRQSESFGGSV